jgi:putative serine protease PepD
MAKPARAAAALIAVGALAGCGSSSSSSSAPCNAIQIANDVLPSVVKVLATAANGASGNGSGEVIRSSGYILTNNHVISKAVNGGTVEVLFSGGEVVPATITGRDAQTDIAVLKVASQQDVKVIGMGSSASVQVGQPVVALGAPLGLDGTVTSGIVSALDRTVQVPGEDDRNALLVSAVQTDAAINPGNSGGALVNCDGDLVGVPTAGAVVPNPSGPAAGGSIGLGFAIPVDFANRLADDIISTGSVTHAYFGLQTVPIPAAAASQEGLPEGLFVTAVTSGGPAAQAGVAANDVITSINGQSATSNLQLDELSITKKPGDQVPIEYVREGKTVRATLTLAAQP